MNLNTLYITVEDIIDEETRKELKSITELEGGVLGELIPQLDVKQMLEIYTMVGNALNMHKNYGYYVETIISNRREEIGFHAQLQQQFDTIEILPPAKEVLNSMIERRISERNILKPIEEAIVN